MERQYKVIEDCVISDSYGEVELDVILQKVAKVEKREGQKADKWTLYAGTDVDGYGELRIVLYRWENDEEILEKEKQIKEQEEKEYQQYLKLKEKYESRD